MCAQPNQTLKLQIDPKGGPDHHPQQEEEGTAGDQPPAASRSLMPQTKALRAWPRFVHYKNGVLRQPARPGKTSSHETT